MIFPEYIKGGDTIGVSALSHPIDNETDQRRFRNGQAQLEKRGYKVIFTDDVFNKADRYGRSAPARQKAAEFNMLLENKDVKAVYSASGGDFLAEMLPYVDIDLFRNNPKWIQGYSDNTSILYYLTTKADIATAYGANFGDFGMEKWDLSVERGLQVLEGNCKVQDSFSKYQNGFGERVTGLEGYNPDADVQWRCITDGQSDNPENAEFEGRLLGGCMDVILNIAGTPYDGTLDYMERYKNDRIIWYLESFDLHFEQMMEGLWKMKEMGWFEHISGFIFGRPLFYPVESWDGSLFPSYEDVLRERLSSLNVPVIMDADIGHKGPQFVMINGAMAKVSYSQGKGAVEYL